MTGKETYTEESYNALLDSVFSRHRSVQDAGFAGDAYKPGLERMRAFDALDGLLARHDADGSIRARLTKLARGRK